MCGGSHEIKTEEGTINAYIYAYYDDKKQTFGGFDGGGGELREGGKEVRRMQGRSRFSAISGNKRSDSRLCRSNVSRDNRDRGRDRRYFYYHWLFTAAKVLRRIAYIHTHAHQRTWLHHHNGVGKG